MTDESIALPQNQACVPHCSARTPSGRRCRLAISDPQTNLCFKHAAEQKKLRDGANLSAQLIGDTQEFTSAVEINRSLGELYKLLARDEIPPRRAAVMAYTCSLLLRSLAAMEHEQKANEEPVQFIFDLPRPKRDDVPMDPERAMYQRQAELYGKDKISLPRSK